MWYHRSLTLCGDRQAHQAWRKQAYEERANSQKQAKEGMWTSCCRLTIEVQWNAKAQEKTYFSKPAILDPSKCFASVTSWYAQHKRSVGKIGLQKNRSYVNASLCGRAYFLLAFQNLHFHKVTLQSTSGKVKQTLFMLQTIILASDFSFRGWWKQNFPYCSF